MQPLESCSLVPVWQHAVPVKLPACHMASSCLPSFQCSIHCIYCIQCPASAWNGRTPWPGRSRSCACQICRGAFYHSKFWVSSSKIFFPAFLTLEQWQGETSPSCHRNKGPSHPTPTLLNVHDLTLPHCLCCSRLFKVCNRST